MFRRVRPFLFALAALVSVAGSAGADDGGLASFIRESVWKRIAGGGMNSASVAVTEEGEVVFSEGFAAADRGGAVLSDEDTLYNIGSISKVFCAVTIMALEDDGVLGLDDRVVDLLPEFRMDDGRLENLTVRMLLNHSSGMPGTVFPGAFSYSPDDGYEDFFMDTLARSSLVHDPGGAAPYCNDGFTLAEFLAERVGAVDYADFLRRRVFEPLGLSSMGVSVGARSDPSLPAARYYRSDGRMEPLEAVNLLGAGGLSCTALDLCRFSAIFYPSGSSVLSETARTEMLSPQPPKGRGRSSLPNLTFGLGWDATSIRSYREAGIQVLVKTGGTGHYSSVLFVVPSMELSVAVLSSGNSDVPELGGEILRRVLSDRGVTSPARSASVLGEDGPSVPDRMEDFQGYYGSSGGGLVRLVFDRKSGTIELWKIDGPGEADRSKEVVGTFRSGLTFVDENGVDYRLAYDDGKRYLLAEMPLFETEIVALEGLPISEDPVSPLQGVAGKLWLRRDMSRSDSSVYYGSAMVRPFVLSDLPGYLVFEQPMAMIDPLRGAAATETLRDRTELILDEAGRSAWLYGAVYIPSDRASPLPLEGTSIRLEEGEICRWMAVSRDGALLVDLPPKGRCLFFDRLGDCIYDSLVDSGPLSVTSGGFLALTGVADDVFYLSESSSSTSSGRELVLIGGPQTPTPQDT